MRKKPLQTAVNDMSDSEDDVVATRNRRLRNRTTAALGDDESDDSSGSEIGAGAPSGRRKVTKMVLEEDDEPGPSSSGVGPSRRCSAGPTASSAIVSSINLAESSEWESDWNSDEERLLATGGEQAAAKLVSKLGYASDSSNSSNDSEKCPICLLSLHDQEIGVPDVCDHMFCAACIEEWSKNVTTCPIDRKNFDAIAIYGNVEREQLLRKHHVQSKSADEVLPVDVVDQTHCEICRQHHSEETMLLCDSCNLGFHMECLNPPMTEVPTGSWYCDCCFASASEEDDEEVQDLLDELNEIGGMRESRLRQRINSPPRIVRTRQSERIRTAILTRSTAGTTPTVDAPQIVPSSSSSSSGSSIGARWRMAAASRTVAAVATATATAKKRRKRRTRRRILRMIISEYDVNNENEKFAIERKKIYKTLRKLKKKRSKRKASSTARTSRNATIEQEVSNCANIVGDDVQRQRYSTGIATLRIFGGRNDLDYFSDEEEEENALDGYGGSGGGEVATQTMGAVRSLARGALNRRRALKSGFEDSSTTGTVDLLDSIMQSQERWHSRNGLRDVKINNGKIIFKPESLDKAKRQQPATIQQAGVGQQHSQGNVSLANASESRTSTTGSSTAGGSYLATTTAAAGASSSSSGSGNADTNFGHNEESGSIPDPSDMSIFVDLPAPKETPQSEEEKKKAKGQEFDMFDIDTPIAAASTAATEQNPSTSSTTTTTTTPVPDTTVTKPEAGSSAVSGGGRFMYTMTSENNCPNFSVYSSETLQFAKADGNAPYDPLDSEQKTDDEFEERDEDLVQLDDDELPQISTERDDEPSDKSDVEESEKLPEAAAPVANGEKESEKKAEHETKSDKEGEEEAGMVSHSTHDAFDSDSDDELKKIEETSAELTTVIETYPSYEMETLTPPLTTSLVAALGASGAAMAAVSVIATANFGPPMAMGRGVVEDDRSYTPCLDEKYQERRDQIDAGEGTSGFFLPNEGIDGMDTELISEEDENTFKEDEAAAAASSSKPSSSGVKKKELAFKKVNKKGKERNYRDKDTDRKKKNRDGKDVKNGDDKENDRSTRRSRERNRPRRPKRKELPRYDIRSIIAEKRPRIFKDPFGRDVTPKRRTRTKSRSRSRGERRNMSISLSPEPRPRNFVRRRSISPRFRQQRQNSRSPLPFRRSPSRSRSRPRMRSITRSRSRFRSRSRVRTKSLSRNRTTVSPRQRLLRSPSRSRTRSRSHSRSLDRRRTKKVKRKKRGGTVSHSRSRSGSRGRRKAPKPPRARKKKTKRRSASPLPPPPPPVVAAPVAQKKKKKNRKRTHSPMVSRSRSRSRSGSPTTGGGTIMAAPSTTAGVLTERFAKVRQRSSWTPPPPTRGKTNGANLTVILTNEEAVAKQNKERERKRKEARRRERAREKNLPSKEVFTSGDNILVSVSFNDKNLNKENQLNEAPAVAESAATSVAPAGASQKRPKDTSKRRGSEGEKTKAKRAERLKRIRGDVLKPVVIIDLDRSPFRVITPSPKAVIVLSDSETEKEKERREQEPPARSSNVEVRGQPGANPEPNTNGPSRKSPVERHEEDIFGPKTPPGFPNQTSAQAKPQAPKFSMQVKPKSLNVRPVNALYDPGDLEGNKTPERLEGSEPQGVNYSVGPNTPPEPAPQSPSPDVYDPFEPTKSPSPSPSQRDNASIGRLSDMDGEGIVSGSGHPKVDNQIDSNTGGETPVNVALSQEETMNGEPEPAPARGSKVTILSNLVLSQPSSTNGNQVTGSNATTVVVSSATGMNNNAASNADDDSDVIFDDFVSSTAPNNNYSTANSNPIKSYTTTNSTSLISKLPLPPGATILNKTGDFMNPTDSPYSPGASDFDDLFEPPPGGGGTSAGDVPDSPPLLPGTKPNTAGYKPSKVLTKGAKKNTFDNLFGSSPNYNNIGGGKRGNKKQTHKRTKGKAAKADAAEDDDPSKLSVKERFLKKLNRLERVVEEVKLVIKPYYNKKQINKEEYKDILRRAVPKICHSRTGEINPIKIQKLIKAYVRKIRGKRRLSKKGSGLTLGLPGTNSNPVII